MKAFLSLAIVISLGGFVIASAQGQNGTCAGIDLGAEADLNGFIPFPSDNAWNTDISAAPVDPDSSNIIAFIGATDSLHPDFGSGFYNGSTIGIPYQVVDSTQPKLPIKIVAYKSESDPGPMPIPANALVEGYPHATGDRHVLVIDRDACFLYELDRAFYKHGQWQADSAAVWDLTIDEQRPYTWTSADAAGLPIFPGLVRYDEVSAGAINHAIRATVPVTREAFTLPATHWASSNTSTSAPPMGTRLRLKASVDISTFPPNDQVILAALKKYGAIIADNGSALFISGSPNDAWDNDELAQIESLHVSDFEVVQFGPIYSPGDVPTGPNPTLTNLVANPPSISPGQSSTLSWTAGNTIYTIVSPEVGAVRTNSAVVSPAATTTYKVYATNQYGRTTRSVTVTVQ